MKKSALMVLSLAALTLLGSCGGGSSSSSSKAADSSATGTSQASTTTAVTAVKISGGETVELGSTLKLTATVEGTGDFSQLVDWKSSDTAILTINDTGLVTPVAAGKATVTATSVTDSTKSASVEITVTEKKVTVSAISAVKAGVEITVAGQVVAVNTKSYIIHDGTAGVMVYLNEAPSVKIGDKVLVSGTPGESKYANGLPQFDANATVEAYEGEFTIPAATALTDAKLQGWKATLPQGEENYSKQFLETTEIQKYSWKTVVGESGGYATFNLDGSDVMIEAAYLDKTVFPTVTGATYEAEGYFVGYNYHNYAAFVFTKLEKVVSDVAPTALEITSSIKGNLYVGGSVKLTAVPAPSGANDAVTWASDNTELATVDETGVVTLKAAGTVNITATSAADTNISKSIALTVKAAPEVDGSTAEKAFTADGLIDYIDSSLYDAKATVYVTGTVKSADYSSDHKNWTIGLIAENGTVELYRGTSTVLDEFTSNASGLVGYTVVAHGNALYYSSASKYELNSGCVIDSAEKGEAEPEEVDLSTAGTVKTVAEVLAAGTADKTELVRVTGVAENLYGAKYGNFYVVDDETGVAAIVYGGYTDIEYTVLEGVYSDNHSEATVVTDSIIGKVVTVVGLLASYKGAGQVANALVTVNENETPAVYSVAAAEDIENGTVALSKTEGVTYGEEITVTATPASGYKLSKLTVTDASGSKTDITESLKFNATVSNTVAATFVSESSNSTTTDFTLKSAKNTSYFKEWTYDNLTLAGAANNNGGWAYVKFGAKSESLEKEDYLGTYAKSNAVSHAVSTVTIALTDGISLSKSGMGASIKVECYSDSEFTTLVSSSDSVEIAKEDTSVVLTGTWEANNYYKLVFNITNTTTTNGVVGVDSITFAS